MSMDVVIFDYASAQDQEMDVLTTSLRTGEQHAGNYLLYTQETMTGIKLAPRGIAYIDPLLR